MCSSDLIGSLVLFFAVPVLGPAGRLDPAMMVLLLLALWALLRWRWGVLPLIGAAALVGIGHLGLAELRLHLG